MLKPETKGLSYVLIEGRPARGWGNRGRGTRTYGSDGSNHKFGTPLQSENNVTSEVVISGLLFGVNNIRKHGQLVINIILK